MTITPQDVKNNIPDLELPKRFKLEVDTYGPTWETAKIPLRRNYYDSFSRYINPPIFASLREYITLPQVNTELLCPEVALPNELAPSIRFSSALSTTTEQAAVILLHVGKPNCIAQLHFDWDHDYVLHTCLSGTKTFYLIPPEAGWILNPIVNSSATCLPRLSKIDQADFLRITNGQVFTLAAGEAVLFPSLWWHAVRYDAPSVAISVRFGSSLLLRPFRALPRSWWLQRVLWHLLKANATENTYAELLHQILGVFFNPRLTWQNRYHHLNQFYQSWLAATRVEQGTHYLAGDNFNAELSLASFELKPLYTIPQNEHEETELDKSTGVEHYLMAGYAQPINHTNLLAQYALLKKSGLEPRRGIIPIINNPHHA